MQPLDSYRWPGLVSLQALEKCSLRCWDGMRRCPWQSSFSSVKRSVEFFHTYKYEKNRRHLVMTLELYFFDQILSANSSQGPSMAVFRSSFSSQTSNASSLTLSALSPLGRPWCKVDWWQVLHLEGNKLKRQCSKYCISWVSCLTWGCTSKWVEIFSWCVWSRQMRRMVLFKGRIWGENFNDIDDECILRWCM